MNMLKGRISVNGSAAFEAPAGVTFSLATHPPAVTDAPRFMVCGPNIFAV
jgi:hypothetical protein